MHFKRSQVCFAHLSMVHGKIEVQHLIEVQQLNFPLCMEKLKDNIKRLGHLPCLLLRMIT